jgi:TRAP-type transport system periplasmic protein
MNPYREERGMGTDVEAGAGSDRGARLGLRSRRQRGKALAAALLALMLLAAGCASGGDEGTDDDEAEGATEDSTDDDSGEDESTSDDSGEQAADAEPVEWVWDHSLPLPDTIYDELAAEVFPAMLAEGTNGQIQLRVLYGEGSPTDALQAIQDGRVDGGAILSTVQGGDHPLWNYGEVAFVFDDFADFQDGSEAVRDMVIEDVEAKTGLINLSGPLPWDSTYIWTTEQPLETLADWNGMRVRAPGIESAKTIEALGGAAVTLGFAEVYPSLERGVIDGFMSSMMATFSINPEEVTDYLNLWPMGYSNYQLMVNPDSFSALTPELQDQVRDVMAEFREVAWSRTQEADASNLDRYEELGMTVVRPDSDAFAELEAQQDELLNDWLSRAGDDGAELMAVLDAR